VRFALRTRAILRAGEAFRNRSISTRSASGCVSWARVLMPAAYARACFKESRALRRFRGGLLRHWAHRDSSRNFRALALPASALPRVEGGEKLGRLGSSHSHSHLLHFRWNSGGWWISVSCGCGSGFDIMVFASLLIQAHNERPGVDAGWRLLFASEYPWPGVTLAER